MELRTYIENYIQKSFKKRGLFKKAAKVSLSEILARVEDFSSDPSPQSLIILLRGLTTSGVYISRTFLRYLVSHVQFNNEEKPKLSDLEKQLIRSVYSLEEIDPHTAGAKEVFNAIFKDQILKHEDENYLITNDIVKLDSTIVLVSGVLNEIFSNAAFERGAQHLSKNLGTHYICPKVHGTKSVKHNADLLKNQLLDYSNDNPDEKLWLLAFSKGGLDCLHFLVDNPEFSEKHICGLSTIASPILGADHLNHKILKFVNSLHDYSDNQIYKFFEKQYDFLFNEFQKSLSQERQKTWFFNNHERLPSLDFYTSLAMESNWNESHFWMMLTKAFFQNQKLNDGIVIAENALFPSYFDSHNFGIVKGHHLVGTRSSSYNQEALLEAHIIYLQYKKLLS
ncbi:MAG: hypothetical protein CME70_07215 [Halobacteriovorax sp.]|nr:hypothetical protein [Halobacteriovorax sp.]|tara:strand:- start:396641 stop:397825 length:1185 start_codon:yes stop_codon:yes gene_type:complete